MSRVKCERRDWTEFMTDAGYKRVRCDVHGYEWGPLEGAHCVDYVGCRCGAPGAHVRPARDAPPANDWAAV